jgi:hypothetical protein
LQQLFISANLFLDELKGFSSIRYTLNAGKGDLQILVDGDKRLFNQYD